MGFLSVAIDCAFYIRYRECECCSEGDECFRGVRMANGGKNSRDRSLLLMNIGYQDKCFHVGLYNVLSLFL